MRSERLSSDKKMEIALQVIRIQMDLYDPASEETNEWDLDMEEHINLILWLLDYPLSPSEFSLETLKNIPLLSETEITLILEHTSSNPITSYSEFLSVEGFTPTHPDLLRYFFVFDTEPIQIRSEIEIVSRVKQKITQTLGSLFASEQHLQTREPMEQQHQIRAGFKNWRFSGIWDRPVKFGEYAQNMTSTSWNLFWNSPSGMNLIFGDFRTKAGSGVLVSSSSSYSLNASGSRLTHFSSNPALSISKSSLKKGIAMGFTTRNSLSINGFWAPKEADLLRKIGFTQANPMIGIRIQKQLNQIRQQVVFVHRPTEGSGVSLSFFGNLSEKPFISKEIKRIGLSGEWNGLSIGSRSSRQQAFQLQNEWIFSDAVQLYFGFRQLSSEFRWKSGSARLHLSDTEAESLLWARIRWVMMSKWPKTGIDKMTIDLLRTSLSTGTTSPTTPIPLNKHSLHLTSNLNGKRNTLILTSQWNMHNDLSISIESNPEEKFFGLNSTDFESTITDEQWQLLHFGKWRHSVHFELPTTRNMTNRLRFQYISSSAVSARNTKEQGFMLGHDLHFTHNSLSFKLKWAVYQTTASTSGRVTEDYIYRSFSTVYVGGAGIYQSFQIAYDSGAMSRRRQKRDSLTVWMQISRQERFKEGIQLYLKIPEPVNYRMSMQTRIRF